jgi:uncharacterized protein
MRRVTLFPDGQDERALLVRVVEIARVQTPSGDPSHDWHHVERVARNAKAIAEAEGADEVISAAAAFLHEVVGLPKYHPEAHRSGELCAAAAEELLRRSEIAADRAARIATCIREHPFSSDHAPSTAESAVLQDADRLDAIGAIGIARCLATAGTIGRAFYSPKDPFCRSRSPDDRRWTIDHFYHTLLRVPEGLQTAAARRLAEPRMAAMRAWLGALEEEIPAE